MKDATTSAHAHLESLESHLASLADELVTSQGPLHDYLLRLRDSLESDIEAERDRIGDMAQGTDPLEGLEDYLIPSLDGEVWERDELEDYIMLPQDPESRAS